MPSGSHGGGGGSHFGGGGSLGGFGGDSMGPRLPRGHFIFFGRTYIMPARLSWVVSLMWILLTVFFFSIFIGITLTSSAKSDIDKIQNDYAYYKEMVNRADSNPEYQTEGIVDDYFLGDSGKYYITYYFLDSNGKRVYGYTYQYYSLQDASSLLVDENITLAINAKNTNITQKTDSIPMDFMSIDISQDGEYLSAKSSLLHGHFALILATITLLGLVATGIVVAKKAKRKGEEEKIEKEKAEEKQNPFTTCPYCGAKIKKTDEKCPHCGAKQLQ